MSQEKIDLIAPVMIDPGMTRQVITTKILPPTNTRGARIKATSTSGISVTLPYDYALSFSHAHWPAVEALCGKLEWSGARFAVGGSDAGYVFVRVDGIIGVVGSVGRRP